MSTPSSRSTPPPPRRWRLHVDPARCIGSAVCVGSAPTLFTLHAGRATARPEPVEADERVIDIAASCPVEAITIHDTDGNPVRLD